MPTDAPYQLEVIRCRPLRVPLTDPFVIASGRVDVTPNVLVEVVVRDCASGAISVGIGEAATLPPVTAETAADVLRTLAALTLPIRVAADASVALDAGPCARAGLDVALHDAIAKLRGLPLHRLLAPEVAPAALRTDITLAIAAPAQMGQWARTWHHRGFDAFKVKVGRDLESDLAALAAIHRAAPSATLRIDANGGYSLADALRLLAEIERQRLPVTCLEEPCRPGDLAAMAAVRAAASCAVLADESCKTLADLDALIAAGAADGVNLKLVKSGGLRACLAIGRRARAAGLQLMVGAMVETRLGIAAAAHLATALGGVEFPDLDTALLLADDPFAGGYETDGARLWVGDAAGHGVAARA